MNFSNKKPKLFKAIFDELAKEQGLDKKIKTHSVPDVWNEIIGVKVASNAKVKKFENGKLYIETNSSTWRAELLLRKCHILKKFAEKLGPGIVEEIIIK